jgi:hypothetical protein
MIPSIIRHCESRRTIRGVIALLVLVLVAASCSKPIPPFGVAHIDRSTKGGSKYPLAGNLNAIGTFPGMAKSGAGYFYDEVLEYRVWLHPERGARRLAGDKDYFAAFAQYEAAAAYARNTAGAESPLVLVLQREHVNEPTPGQYEWKKGPRVTEWKPAWLAGARRGPHSIPEFLAARKAQNGNREDASPSRGPASR